MFLVQYFVFKNYYLIFIGALKVSFIKTKIISVYEVKTKAIKSIFRTIP